MMKIYYEIIVQVKFFKLLCDASLDSLYKNLDINMSSVSFSDM